MWIRVWFDGSESAGKTGFGTWLEVAAPEAPGTWHVIALMSSPGPDGTSSLSAEISGSRAALDLLRALVMGTVPEWHKTN